MFFKLSKLGKLSLIAVLFSFLTLSCSNKTAVNPESNLESISNTNASACPAGSENIKLDLANISLTREENIPLMYQGYNNLEGPVWHEGALYYSNMGTHQPDENGFALSNQTTIWRWIIGEKPQVWMEDTLAGTNGLAVDSKGNLVGARQLDGSLSYIDWQTKQITPIVTSYQDKRFNSPNDLTIADDDTVYFTDPNWNTPSNINIRYTSGWRMARFNRTRTAYLPRDCRW